MKWVKAQNGKWHLSGYDTGEITPGKKPALKFHKKMGYVHKVTGEFKKKNPGGEYDPKTGRSMWEFEVFKDEQEAYLEPKPGSPTTKDRKGHVTHCGEWIYAISEAEGNIPRYKICSKCYNFEKGR